MRRIHAAFVLAFIALIQNSAAVDIDCSIHDNVWTPFGTFEECLAYSVNSESRGEVLGSVDSYRDIETLKSLYIYQSPYFYYIPSGITEKFQSLEVFIAAHTGLKEVTKEDLKPFAKLRGLYIDHSPIQSIPQDLFTYNQVLEELSLQKNGIKHIHPETFNPLLNLQSFHFDNDCYSNRQRKGRKSVEDLFGEIERSCRFPESDNENLLEQSGEDSKIE